MAKNPTSVNAGNLNKINEALEKQAELYSKIGAKEEAIFLRQKMAENNRTAINKLLKEQYELTSLIGPLSLDEIQRLKDIKKSLIDISKEHSKLISSLKVENELLKTGITWRQAGVNLAKEMGNQLKIGWTYLQAQDKIIKSTILNLGMSGTKAAAMRLSFEQSAQFAATLGANLEDIQKIMEGFADETGRARALSAQMVEDVVTMGKGTGLGIENATKLGAQFEYMGVDVKNTMNFVQGVVDTSERMGVNTTKVLKTVNDNFKKLSTFTFQGGVKAMGQMAMNAEKTRVSLATALNVAEATRGLDQVIELGANLQVMGGEFAKMDPFQWLYMARNEPDKMTEKISEMTKGIYTLKKNSDGTFEKFISPEDRDRLANVAKSLGISQEEISQIAQRRLDLSLLDKQTAGMGLTKREKELIQGASTMNSATGKYQVYLAGTMTDISTLTKEQANSFASEQVLLKERAKEALTFDEAFKNTINALKAALLPLLNVVNGVLKVVRPIFDAISKFGTGGAIAALVGGALLLKGAIWGITRLTENFVSKLPMLSKIIPGSGGSGGAAGSGAAGGKWWQTKAGTIRKGAPEMMKAKGMSNLATGGGIGAAALGTGAGVGAAAAGISLLADAMSKLDVEKAKILQNIVITIGLITGVGIAAATTLMFAAPSIVAFGTAAGAASIGIGMLAIALTPIGLSVLAIGAGIGLATAGIGYMFTGIGNLVTGVGNLVTSFSNLKISSETLTAIKTIALSAPDFKVVGDSFANINAALSGSKDDWVAVQNAITAISGANISGGGMLAELANLLRSPLKVEFTDKNVAIVSNITMEIDGEKFMQKVYNVNTSVQKHAEARNGTSGQK